MRQGMVLLLLLPVGLVRGQEVVDPQEIARLVAQLGSAVYQDRESAQARLIEIGAPAIDAVRAALESSDLELSQRAKVIYALIAPRENYHRALKLVEEGQLTEAANLLRSFVAGLPRDTRPEPNWALRIIEEVQAFTEETESSTRCIAYHNLLCLLREAGLPCPRAIEQARAAYRTQLPRWSRGYRLLAMVEWEAGNHKTAEQLWTEGTKLIESEADESEAAWHRYDEGSYLALRGEIEPALAALREAIKVGGQRAAVEADTAADFYPLRGRAAFEQILREVLGDQKLPVAAPKVIPPATPREETPR